ncbi:MAG: HD domain-containing protein [Oscillospiraceae bacterium]|nr:HD domain-containing protein [Oscillospiraceae bacterium]
MTLYTGVILLTELMLFTMAVHVLNYSGFTRIEKKWYLITFLSIMLCAGAEWFALTFDARGAGFVFPLTVITVVQFSLTPLLPVFFAGALGMHRGAKVAGIVFSLNALAELFSAFTGWIFRFDENGTYIRSHYYFIYEAFYIVSLIFLVVALVIVGKRFKKRDIFTIVMILVIMVTAILPLILKKIYTDYLGIGICACLCYIYYNDLIQEDIQVELVAKQKKISDIQEHIISGMANLIENRDTETGEHVLRTSSYVKTLAEEARGDGVYRDILDDNFISMMYTLAPMHDIGKIVVSDSILRKPGKLTAEEYEQMKRHASEGGKIVREILEGVTDEVHLAFAADIATFHHERWDGRGYPTGLAGEKIPLSARIMAIADVFDALVSERCYKNPMTPEHAFEIIREEAGSHFDPNLAEVFLNHRDLFTAIARKTHTAG